MSFDPRRLPFIGDDIANVGQVYDIVSQPCGPNPYIAVRAFFSYTPLLLWSLFKPEPLDVSFNRQGFRHSRIRRRGFEALITFELPAPQSPGLYWAIARGYQLTERIGWYLLVADATTDFLLNWSSMAYEYSGCDGGTQGEGIAFGQPGVVGPRAAGVLNGATGTNFDFTLPGTASQGAVGITDSLPVTVAAQLTGSTSPVVGKVGAVKRVILRRDSGPGDREDIEMDGSGAVNGNFNYSVVRNYYAPLPARTDWQILYELSEDSLVTISDYWLKLDVARPAGLTWDP